MEQINGQGPCEKKEKSNGPVLHVGSTITASFLFFLSFCSLIGLPSLSFVPSSSPSPLSPSFPFFQFPLLLSGPIVHTHIHRLVNLHTPSY